MALALTGGSTSQAFQTGLAHGKVLAQTHAAQGKIAGGSEVLTPADRAAQAKTPTAAEIAAAMKAQGVSTGGSTAPASQSADPTTLLLQLLTQNVGQTPTQLSTQANTLAHNDVAAQVQAFQQQQALANTQALQRAQQINLAAQAAARYEAGLGDQTAASFDNAAKSEAGFAQGYSGQLQQTASDAAAKVQAGLAAVGAPAGQAPSSTQGTDLANVLYGLGGQIPANTLETAGQAAAAAQRQLPAATLGYGQQQAQGLLGQGAATAAAIQPSIANALSQQPTLAAQYLSQLGTQNNDAVTQRNSEIELASLIQNRTATQTTDAAKAAKPSMFGSSATGYYSIDPTSGKVTQVTPPVVKPTTPKTFGGAKTGYYTLGTDGTVTQITPPAPAAPPKTGSALPAYGGLTPSGLRTLTTATTKLVAGLGSSVPQKVHYGAKGVNTPEPGTGKQPVPYAEALQQAIAQGPDTPAWTKKATQIVNSTPAYSTMGKNGRPYTGPAAVKAATAGATQAFKAGVPKATALAAAEASGKYPKSVLVSVIDKVYAPLPPGVFAGAFPGLSAVG